MSEVIGDAPFSRAVNVSVPEISADYRITAACLDFQSFFVEHVNMTSPLIYQLQAL
jgi:hypothetical protein